MPGTDVVQTIRRASVWYAASILLTGSVNFISIFFIKRQLGDGQYAFFNMVLNTILVAVLVGQGWIVNSTLRFGRRKSTDADGVEPQKLLCYGFYSSLVLLTPATVVLLVLQLPQLLLPVAVLLFSAAMQAVMVAITQAGLQPQRYFYAEGVRSAVLLAGMLAPGLPGIEAGYAYYLYCFAAAYVAAFIFLWLKLDKKAAKTSGNTLPGFKKLFYFGLPMSLWLGGMYFIVFSDRYFLLPHVPGEEIGNYAALADLLVKGMGFLLSPLVNAAYPLLAAAEAGPQANFRPVIRKLLRRQIMLVVAAAVGYILFYKLVFGWLRVPPGLADRLFWSGLLVLAGSACWQINTLLHKPMEMRLATGAMLLRMLPALALYTGINLLLVPAYGILATGAAFLATGLLYTALVWKHNRLHG